jgi:hypothetical protein
MQFYRMYAFETIHKFDNEKHLVRADYMSSYSESTVLLHL